MQVIYCFSKGVTLTKERHGACMAWETLYPKGFCLQQLAQWTLCVVLNNRPLIYDANKAAKRLLWQF